MLPILMYYETKISEIWKSKMLQKGNNENAKLWNSKKVDKIFILHCLLSWNFIKFCEILLTLINFWKISIFCLIL